MQEIDKYIICKTRYAHENVDKIIVANKSDQTEKRKVSYDAGYNFAKMNGLEFTQVSALSSANISDAFDQIAKKVLKRLENTPSSNYKMPSVIIDNKSKKQNSVEKTKKKTCC